MASILVIDDDDLVRLFVRETLENAGFSVTTARNGNEGLRLLAQSFFDVLITDVVMPERDGLETIQEALRIRPETKIIAMSGGGNWLAPDKCLSLSGKLGAKRTIAKPIGPEGLLREVRSLLDE